MTLLTLATLALPDGPLGILFKIAIAVVIVWGVWELIKWGEWSIPRPLIIVFTVLACILVIYWLFELFQALI